MAKLKDKAKSCFGMSAQEMLGHKVRDVISGFEGTATAHVIYISGCNQILVSPMYDKKDKKWPKSNWIDDQRLEVIPGSKQIRLNNSQTPGHDIEPPVR